jgi:hypothetical protein
MHGPKPCALPLGDTPLSNKIIQKKVKNCQEFLEECLKNSCKKVKNIIK